MSGHCEASTLALCHHAALELGQAKKMNYLKYPLAPLEWITIASDVVTCCPQVVDMRWGVPTALTADHTSTELCLREIESCQRISLGPTFIVCCSLLLFAFLSTS